MPNNLLGMDNYYLNINGKSKHFGDSDVEMNENNTGFGITGEKEQNGLVKSLMAGRYQSGDYYAGVGTMAGGITGYDDAVSPLAGLMLSLGKKDRARLNMLLAPPTKKTGAALMMSLGIPFK